MPGRDPCQTLRELLATMRALRNPGGCPWDAEQTPSSLAPYILEEACETIEAIETGSPQRIADELGDLLLQVVFQAQIFSERGEFDFADVAAGINAKLVRRHPHVFADATANLSPGDLAEQWEQIKRQELTSHVRSPGHPLGEPPRTLPALQRAQKLIAKAVRMGVPMGRIASQCPSIKMTEDEIGTALLSLVGQAESSGLDAEQALRLATRKFTATITVESQAESNDI